MKASNFYKFTLRECRDYLNFTLNGYNYDGHAWHNSVFNRTLKHNTMPDTFIESLRLPDGMLAVAYIESGILRIRVLHNEFGLVAMTQTKCETLTLDMFRLRCNLEWWVKYAEKM